MKNLKVGTTLLHVNEDEGWGYFLKVEEKQNKHFKIVYTEIPKKRGKPKSDYYSGFTWCTITKFQKEVKRLNMQLVNSDKEKEIIKEGI